VIAVKWRFWQLSRKHCTPDRGRNLVFEPQLTPGELILLDTAEQLDASDHDGGRSEVLEAEHRSDSALDARPSATLDIFRFPPQPACSSC
jgi:hypothetical protein